MFDMRLSGMSPEYATEFSIPYTVGPEGNINLPYVGEIRAQGLTPPQLERAIQSRLVAEKIFTKPTVIINVAAVARIISVTGGVRQPQRLQWSPDMTLNMAIGQAGGLNEFASPKGVRVVRNGAVVGTYDLRQIQKDLSRDPRLLPGDQVLVRE